MKFQLGTLLLPVGTFLQSEEGSRPEMSIHPLSAEMLSDPLGYSSIVGINQHLQFFVSKVCCTTAWNHNID